MKKRLLSLLLALVMVLGLLPMTALADGGEEIDVTVSYFNTAFVLAPQNLKVSSGLAESYGYADKADTVTALDVLVAAHEAVFGEDFTAATAGDYLTVSDSGYVTNVFGDGAGNIGVAVNGAMPVDPDSEYDKSMGGYTGLTIPQTPVAAGDTVELFSYQDAWYMDQYTWFEADGARVNALTVTAGADFTLTLRGYMYAYCGSYNEQDRAENTTGIESAQLATLSGAEATDLEGKTTGKDGAVTLSFSQAGTYTLTAYMPESEITDNYATPIFAPVCTVTVLPDASITVPAGVTLEVGRKDFSGYNYQLFTPLEPAATVTDEETGATTYYFDIENKKTCTYRVSGEDIVTYAGLFTKTAGYSLTLTDELLRPDDSTRTTVDHSTAANNSYNVADIYLNINAQGYLKLEQAGDSYQLVPLRTWQAVDSVTANNFVQPDFHYAVVDLNGEASSDVVEVSASGELTALGEGTAIVLVTYDAMRYPGGAGGPFFGAIWPENTGVFVVSVGAGDSGITTGMTLNAGRNDSELKLSGDAIDAEHDVIYFTGDAGTYTFTPGTEGCTVSVANPTVDETLRYTGFTAVNADGTGAVTVPLTQGRNIVRLEKDGKAEYQVITAKRVSYTVNNGEEVHPGDTLSIRFDTLYHPANKLAGIYNMNAIVAYTQVPGYEGKLAGASSAQYNFANNANAQTVANVLVEKIVWGAVTYAKESDLVVPEDYAYDTYTLSGGAIFLSGWGDPYGNHRGVTLTDGKAPNLNAATKLAWMGSLPDIEIPITVADAELESIVLTLDGVKTDYYTGDAFDPTNLVVTAVYDNGKTQIASNYTITPEILTADTTEVTVSYRGKTAAIPVTVTDPQVVSIAVTNAPNKTYYTAGDVFDPTGMVVTATYDNGRTAETTAYRYVPNRPLTEDDTAMTITYTGSDAAGEDITAAQPITVSPAPGGEEPRTITVRFTLLGDEHHDSETDGQVHTLADGNLSTWIAETEVTVPSGSLVIDVVSRALGLAGIPYENPQGNYITSIRGLSEMDNGANSGWMYTLNGRYPTLGISEQTVRQGDVIVFHYTDDYTRENFDMPDVPDVPGTPGESGGEDEELPFTDIGSHWACDDIVSAWEKGLIDGVGGGLFAPEGKLSRAMLVTMLYRMEGKPAVTGGSTFSDVQDGAWYADAVAWAAGKGIVLGFGDGTFAPSAEITREQMAAILLRYSVWKGYDTSASGDLSAYTDAGSVSAWALDGMKWANGAGLITGRSADTLAPQGGATRAEAAVILVRFTESLGE